MKICRRRYYNGPNQKPFLPTQVLPEHETLLFYALSASLTGGIAPSSKRAVVDGGPV
jgi:hypothetical protein